MHPKVWEMDRRLGGHVNPERMCIVDTGAAA